MPLTLAVINIGGLYLASRFPRTDATQAIESVSPSVKITEVKRFCRLPHGTYIFGYDLEAINEQGQEEKVGRICRDILNRQWVWAFGSW